MINDYADGTFPSHEWDTGEPHNYEQLIKEVQIQGAEFGVMFDGDADRIGIVTNTGKIVAWDIIYAIIAKQILQNTSQKDPVLLYDCMSSKITAETIEKYWWIAKISRVWRFFINNKMIELGAIAWWEVSGHYMFWELGCVESVLIAQYYIMKELENYNDMDAMIMQYQKYYKWPVQSIEVKNKEKIIEQIKSTFSTEQQENIDGISIYSKNYRFNLRASNTENKIRFSVEADNKDIREQIVEQIKKRV
jgi:phosphomannomutase